MTIPNILPNQPFERKGDKVNSDFYEEHLLAIYKARDTSGLSQNYRGIHHILVEVDLGAAKNYISELLIMTPYNYLRSFEDETYRYHILRISNENPDFLIREQITPTPDRIWAMNHLSKNGRQKPYTRYIGEVYNVKDQKEVITKLTDWEIRFLQDLPASPSKNHIHWTEESIYTWNFTGYIQEQTGEKTYDMVREWSFQPDELELVAKMKKLQSEVEIDI